VRLRASTRPPPAMPDANQGGAAVTGVDALVRRPRQRLLWGAGVTAAALLAAGAWAYTRQAPSATSPQSPPVGTEQEPQSPPIGSSALATFLVGVGS